MKAKIKGASILVFENTDEVFSDAGMIVKTALSTGGYTKFKWHGSYSGRFFADLNSGAKYDLIIADAEDHATISGEFWDAISRRVAGDKAGLIVEMWYLDNEAYGPISKILGPCGIQFARDLDRIDSIYWWEPSHEIFTTPNALSPMINTNQFWPSGLGDRVALGPGGDATLLAGYSSSKSSDALLATCGGGRQVWQFFNDHDYPYAQTVQNWQNYIHWTLKNHFAVVP